MPLVADKTRIRTVLLQDPVWSAYALADLDPTFFRYTRWIEPAAAGVSIVLVYQAFAVPVVLAAGQPDEIRETLGEIDRELVDADQVYLVAQPAVLRVLGDRFPVRQLRPMLRMVLGARSRLPSIETARATRLGRADVESVQALFATGRAKAESPDFFLPEMLDGGLYYGVREGEELVSIAGTHVLSKTEGVAAVGNVYTREDHRGRGLAARTTSCVARGLVDLGLSTIVLNVSAENGRAIRLYERLGFIKHVDYFEAVADRERAGVEEATGSPGHEEP